MTPNKPPTGIGRRSSSPSFSPEKTKSEAAAPSLGLLGVFRGKRFSALTVEGEASLSRLQQGFNLLGESTKVSAQGTASSVSRVVALEASGVAREESLQALIDSCSKVFSPM